MKAFQFDRFRYQGRNPQSLMVVVLKGRHKGHVGLATSTYGRSLILDGINDPIPYVNCEHADSFGNPQIEHVVDQTGREIKIGSWLVYSGGGGKKAHRLEIGVVEKIGDAGGLTVTRKISNGNAIKNGYRSDTKIVNDADRTLVLPVLDSDLVEWVMRGFTDLKDRA